MERRLLALSGAVTGALAAGLAYRRLLGGRRDRLDLYFEDGTFVTFTEGAADAERLLSLARQVIAAVHATPSEWPIPE